MRFMAIFAALYAGAGCAANAQHARVALTLQGAAAGAAEQQRCLDAVRRAGAIVDANAPLKAIVTLDPSGARLQVLSPTRGLVRDEAKPAGTVEPLCQDAALAAAATPEANPTTTYGGPPGSEPLAPRPMPTTSGGSFNGPIQ
jgi:hypothetical protein